MDLLALVGFCLIIVLLWVLKRHIQNVAQATTSALEELTYLKILIAGRSKSVQGASQAWGKFRYPLSDLQSEDRIFVSTVFKSGTKLLEHIVAKLTGLGINAPDMSAGSDYESVDPITFESGKFFIWHNIPGDSVKARLIAANAKPIFLIRNVYDLAVSQYFHFADDIDAEIGHSTRTADYFAEMGRDEGISLVLCGATSHRFHWHGYGYYLRQIQEMLQFSKEYPCHVVNYDRLVLNKRNEIERLANFLNLEVSPELLSELIDSSRLDTMREARVSAVGCGKHFRKGTPGDHVNVLKLQHYHMINHLKLTFAPGLDALCEELGYGDVTAGAPEANREDHTNQQRDFKPSLESDPKDNL